MKHRGCGRLLLAAQVLTCTHLTHTKHTHTGTQTLGQNTAGTPPPNLTDVHNHTHTHTHSAGAHTVPHQLSLEVLLQGLMTKTERTKEQGDYEKED